MMDKTGIYTGLKVLVVAGNVLFVLWMRFNGMDEGWKATPYQIMSYAGLTVLLALNTYLILRKTHSA
jgi:hypothetical protein